MMELVLLVASTFAMADNHLLGTDNHLLGRASVTSPVATARSESDAVEEAVAKSLKTGRPVILWIGGNFCERCVNDSKGEFIHAFLDEWRGQRGPATVILAPHGDRTYRVATVNRWTVGSHDWGHIPSARRLVHEWQSRSEQGNLAPIPLLHLSGGDWGWPADRNQLPSPSAPSQKRPTHTNGVSGRVVMRGSS